MRMTDSFTWEDLPTRDAATGQVTKAGYMPTIDRFSKYAVAFIIIVHALHSAYRIVLYRDMVFTAWHFLDSSVSPIYEIANITQVTFRTKSNCDINPKVI
jgi:hypothetical protein